MSNQKFSNQKNNYTLGIILIAIGAIILIKKLGFIIPFWLLSWPMIFIAIGLVILINSQFKNISGYFFLVFGSFFLLKKYVILPAGFEGYLIAFGLIGAGVYFLINQNKAKQQFFGSGDYGFNNFDQDVKEGEVIEGEDSSSDTASSSSSFQPEIISSQAFLSGDQRRILSKNFKGGKISAILGGAEIDLSQADMTEPAMLNVEVALGGVKLIIPPHWSVQINVSNVLAGVEDKRLYPQVTPDPKKVLKIYGSVILGGLEIKSF